MSSTDLQSLERDLLARADATNNEASLEALPVETLGKQGSRRKVLGDLHQRGVE